MADNPSVSRRARSLLSCTAMRSSEQHGSGCQFDDRIGEEEAAPRAGVSPFLRLSFAIAIFAFAQPLLFSSRGQSSSPTRDAEAVQILQTSINSMGGQAAWSRVTGATSKWDMTKPYDPHYSAVETWTDDWSLGFMVFRHEVTAEDGKHSISADVHHSVLNQWPGGQNTLPKIIQDIALPLHLPAASLLIALADPRTTLRYAGLSSTGGSFARVTIMKIDAHGFQEPLTRQDWTFDMQSGYPTEVEYYTEDLTHNTPHRETIEYADYQSRGALIVPTMLRCNMAESALILQLTSLFPN
jgi:hypothetical protein